MVDHSELDAGSVPVSPFERIKRVDLEGNEYWSARDLMPILGYASWQQATSMYQDAYSSLCLENPRQSEMFLSSKIAEIGSGALREIQDWHISYLGLDRILSRAANHKPEALRELRRRNGARNRIEIEIGAVLFDFCEQANVSITHQHWLEDYIFDFFIDDRLLIEVDEARHSSDLSQARTDKAKDQVAIKHGYKLLRIAIPLENVAKLCGTISRLLFENCEVGYSLLGYVKSAD